MEPDSKNSIDCAEYQRTKLVSPLQVEISGYSELELLAEGATGFVYSAKRNIDNKSVALKIYKKELIPDSESAKRFQHEVGALQTISHPNIVEIFDAGHTESGVSYIAMEMMEGCSIRTILETEGVFEPRRAVIVMREICRALQALHAKQIIHRDIKPNNIILDEHNVARLVDFGIAKVLGSSNETLSHYGTILGTPAYMSPEQCLNQKIDQRTDIYSVGCTLFEMLTGTQAFASSSAMEALAKQIDEDRSFIEIPLVSAGAPPDLRQIISRTLSREPEERYNNVDELDHELSAFLLGKPLSFPVVKQPKRQVRFFKSTIIKMTEKSWQIIASCAALIAIMLVVRSNFQFIEQTLHRAQASQTSPILVLPPSTAGQITIVERVTRKPIWVDTRARNVGDALTNAVAHGVSLHNADLHGAQFYQHLKLDKADLSNADLSRVFIASGSLTQVNLHGANFTNARIDNIQLINDDCSAANFMSARMMQALTPKTNFKGADFSFAHLAGSKCADANFNNVNFTKTDLSRTNFRNSDLSFADFRDATFMFEPFNFEQANLTGVKNFLAVRHY